MAIGLNMRFRESHGVQKPPDFLREHDDKQLKSITLDPNYSNRSLAASFNHLGRASSYVHLSQVSFTFLSFPGSCSLDANPLIRKNEELRTSISSDFLYRHPLQEGVRRLWLRKRRARRGARGVGGHSGQIGP